MRTASLIELTDEQRQQLQRWTRSSTVSVRLARLSLPLSTTRSTLRLRNERPRRASFMTRGRPISGQCAAAWHRRRFL